VGNLQKACTGESATSAGCGDDGGMKTRTLMLLALITGLAILAAGAIQILMAKP
jgi:hypothetical protein